MVETSTFITVTEVKEALCVSESKAYHVIQDLNKELKKKGYMVVAGRVSRQYFLERFYGLSADEEKED